MNYFYYVYKSMGLESSVIFRTVDHLEFEILDSDEDRIWHPVAYNPLAKMNANEIQEVTEIEVFEALL